MFPPLKAAGQTFKIPWRNGGTSGCVGGNYQSGVKGRGADSVARNLNKSIFFPLKAAIFQSDGYCKHHSCTQHYKTCFPHILSVLLTDAKLSIFYLFMLTLWRTKHLNQSRLHCKYSKIVWGLIPDQVLYSCDKNIYNCLTTHFSYDWKIHQILIYNLNNLVGKLYSTIS